MGRGIGAAVGPDEGASVGLGVGADVGRSDGAGVGCGVEQSYVKSSQSKPSVSARSA